MIVSMSWPFRFTRGRQKHNSIPAKMGRQIIYIHQHFHPPTEGGGGRPYEFARRLVENGNSVTMIAGGSTRLSYEVSGFRVEQINSRYSTSMSFMRRLISFAEFMIKASWVSSRVPADVVLASSTPLTAVIPGIAAAKLNRARLVVEIRDLWPSVPRSLGYLPKWLYPPAVLLERFIYYQADHVIALSPHMATGVRKVRPAVPISMIPNAADNQLPANRLNHREARTQFGIHGHESLVYYAGSLGNTYAPQWLAAFAIALAEINIKMVVAGQGTGLGPARRELLAAGLDAEQVFIGPLPRQEVFNLAHASDLAISSIIDHPALHGNSLNKVFDAMAAQKPILFNHGGWLADLVTKHGGGFIIPREPAQAAQTVRRLLTEIDLHAVGKKAHDLGLAEFDRDVLFEQFEKALFPTPDAG